jgi:DNA-binding winged helix-turn-helix (wHTH) protein/TolB-like protein/tetratricopeptide (TPR) repeat protein
MYESVQDAVWVHSIDLAQEADFDLGLLRVRPARCEVEWAGVSQTLQRRVMQVLVALAQARGSVVSQDDLVIRCWRGLSVSDDAIYRCISILRKLAADYPDAPFAIEAIPGVGYRLTTSNSAEEGAAVEATARSQAPSRFRALAIAAALLVLVTAGAAFWMFHGRAPDHQSLRVAVQSFEALSGSESARSLARRIPNEVVDVLGDSQIETVLVGEQAKVAARSANQSPGLIVTGIVRDDGRNTVLDLRLEDGTTRAALWSTEFRRDSREASDLPLEVAARVADAVNMIDFARNADPPLTDDSALTALIQSNDMLRGASDEAWAPMLQKAQDIVARHPEFAFGHSILAAGYAWASDSINIPDRARAMRDAARGEANLALKLDPEDAGSYAVLSGLVAPFDHREREAILLRGIRSARHPKQPLAALYSYEGLLLGNVGRLREALSYQLVAHAKDEWGPARTTKLAASYANMGDLTAAMSALQKAVQFWPNHPGVWRWQQYISGFYERPSDALAVFKLLDERSSLHESNAIWRTFIEAKAAHSAQVTQAAGNKIRAAADHGTISRENEIMMLAALGESKQAIEVANSVLDHQQLEPWFLFTPVTRNLRQDPGFVSLASRMGLIKYWRETGKKPDFCIDPAARSECSQQLSAALKLTPAA